MTFKQYKIPEIPGSQPRQGEAQQRGREGNVEGMTSAGGRNTLERGVMQSRGYVPNIRGWKLDAEDTVEINELRQGGSIISIPTTGNIQTAIDTVSDAGGGIVQLVAGTYILTSDINMKDSVILAGAGKDLTILDFENRLFSIKVIGTSTDILTNISLRSFTVQNSGKDDQIEIAYSDFFNISNVITKGSTSIGMSINNCQNFSVRDSIADTNGGIGFFTRTDGIRSTNDFTFVDCTAIDNAGNGFGFNSNVNDMSFGRIVGCASKSNDQKGFDFAGSGSSALDTSIVACVATTNTNEGFDVSANCQRIHFTNCFSELNGGDGFEINATDCVMVACYSGDPVDINSDCVLVGNIFAESGNPNTNLTLSEDFTQAAFNQGQTATTFKEVMTMKNTSGGSLAAGDMVTFKAAAGGDEVTTTTTKGDDLVYGMVLQSITSNSYGRIVTRGKTTALKVDGGVDIAIGDFIGCSTATGIGVKAEAGDMAVAVALEAYATNDANGVIDALLISPRKI